MYPSNQPAMRNESEKDSIIRDQKSTINLLLVYVIVELSMTLIYFLLNIGIKIVTKNIMGSTRIFEYLKYVYSFLSVIELVTVIIITALIRNSTVRLWFIIFSVLKLITCSYYVYNNFK
jgi:hypothetical protein